MIHPLLLSFVPVYFSAMLDKKSLHKGLIPYGGFISATSVTPTSFPAPNRLGLNWEVQFI